MLLNRPVTLLGAVASLAAALSAIAAAADWNPLAWTRENTVELRTVAAGEGEHWFPVWLVVIDDQLYVRLGTRAAGRIDNNATAPFIAARIAGQQFDRVRTVPAPDYAARVAQAMADKYWSDLFVHWMSHPMTLRLMPEPNATQ
jgi:hypothetical protein